MKPGKRLTFTFALEIFAGKAGFSRALAGLGFAVIPWDIELGEQYDRTRESVRKRIVGWITSGMIACIHLGPPSGTFSRIRDPPGLDLIRNPWAFRILKAPHFRRCEWETCS